MGIKQLFVRKTKKKRGFSLFYIESRQRNMSNGKKKKKKKEEKKTAEEHHKQWNSAKEKTFL